MVQRRCDMPDTNPDVKVAVIAAIDDSWREFRRVLTSLNAQEMDTPGLAGAWSAKDILGHITTWEEHVIRSLAFGRNETTPGFDLNRFNADEVTAMSHLSSRDILVKMEETHRSLRDALAAAPPSHFEYGSPMRGTIDADTAAHYDEHARDIKKWVRNRPASGDAGKA
ncbi:MAG: ClbS/DfsB family four-helix bundle protein [Dehalococcoidia bacterium]|nr:ClbS/DfsB family four-helix bundle protein [Dehalococcoidia bacterium]MSQ34824.1 ClbS/DfsB family four-helix bundle protein [Dehalococcoidia bacterium]